MHLGPIDLERMTSWIDQRAQSAGAAGFDHGREIQATAGPCTGDIVRLAKTVFFLLSQGMNTGVVDQAMAEISEREHADMFVSMWSKFTLTQRRVLRAIAHGDPPTASQTLRQQGIRAASSAQSALAALLERQILRPSSAGTKEFENPFFGPGSPRTRRPPSKGEAAFHGAAGASSDLWPNPYHYPRTAGAHLIGVPCPHMAESANALGRADQAGRSS